jgi:dihydroxyacetone kinase-like predicted kinase
MNPARFDRERLLQRPFDGRPWQLRRHHLADFPWLRPGHADKEAFRHRARFSDAFVKGKEVAYKAVMRPVEGTILTVIRESSALKREAVKKDTSIEEASRSCSKEAKNLALQHTPDLLPILKEVGVVDSGGAGLCVVIEGMAQSAHGQFVATTMEKRARRSDFLHQVP